MYASFGRLLKFLLITQTNRVRSQGSSGFFLACEHFLAFLKLSFKTNRLYYIANKYK